MDMEKISAKQAQLTCSKADVSLHCNLDITEIEELMEYGAISYAEYQSVEENFSWPSVLMLQTANRLRMDYDLDLFTIVLIMDFLKKIQTLEEKIGLLEAAQQKNVASM
jgi:chaperone modulatory protein CbpM